MPFNNWIEGLGQKKTRELQKDLSMHYMNGSDPRPFNDIPSSVILKFLDDLLTECHERGIDLVKEYGSSGES